MSTIQIILEKAKRWIKEPYDLQTRQEVEKLIEQGSEALTDAFYKDLHFGTGGMRAIMGVGTNRVNKYTIGMATQGLANYLKSQFPNENCKVAIAYDSRHNSKNFARQAAEILVTNQIKVYLFEDLRPTPELSFAIRHLDCHSGIMITASHNPPEYNGYKVYWRDGGQLVPPHDKEVAAEMHRVTLAKVEFDNKTQLIEFIGEEVDKAYIKALQGLSLSDKGKDELKIVFTPIHGSSITIMPNAFKANGFTNFYMVNEQSVPDGNFPTVKSPNPEEAEALSISVKKAEELDADLVIGADPDADRVGLAVRDDQGKMIFLNGNQIAVVLIYYLLEQWQEAGKLSGNEFIARTIVTTGLIDEIARYYHVDCMKCLTGFKWIAELIHDNEGKKKFIAGGEESCGYLIGDFVRDKDAISSALILAEAAAWNKSKGSSLYGLLLEIYQKFGYYQENLFSITKKGRIGAEEITTMIKNFRATPPEYIGNERVVEIRDYQSSISKNLSIAMESFIDLPKSNVVQFITDKGSIITIRPSETESKIKFYFSLNTKLTDIREFNNKQEQLQNRVEGFKKSLGLISLSR